MGRRKRVLDDGDDSDSSNNSGGPDFGDFDDNDPDAREERALFEDPYKRKRRRKNGKEDALYGVFGEDSEQMSQGKLFCHPNDHHTSHPCTAVSISARDWWEIDDGVQEGYYPVAIERFLDFLCKK